VDTIKAVLKIIMGALLVGVLSLFMLWFILDLVFNPLRGSGGEFSEKTVSPSGRWEVRFYYIDPGAMASASYRGEAKDRTGEYPVRNFYHDFEIRPFRWLDSNRISIHGNVVDLRGGSHRPSIW
jgi:hypothetical protein